MKEKVVIGMSGGVDSTTSAFLLKEQGYDVVGVSLNQNIDENNSEIKDAENMAKFLGIEYKIIDIHKEFKDKVINNFLDGYNLGETPSPCIICDDEIKFKNLFEYAKEIGAKYVATGHYASVEYNKEFSKYLLKKTSSLLKDQTYMLYRLDSEKLKNILFPLEKYTKSEVRKIAENIGVEIFNKKDSQGLCFAKEGYKKYLKENLGEKIKKGNYVNKKGEIIGEHEGYQYYTIGQRRGLGLNLSQPVFVTDINVKTNEVVLGEYKDLFLDVVELKNYKFNVDMEKLYNKVLIGRPRFSSQGFEGKIIKENEKIFFKYFNPNPQNTRGQHLVIYYKNFVVGGGVISL